MCVAVGICEKAAMVRQINIRNGTVIFRIIGSKGDRGNFEFNMSLAWQRFNVGRLCGHNRTSE